MRVRRPWGRALRRGAIVLPAVALLAVCAGCGSVATTASTKAQTIAFASPSIEGASTTGNRQTIPVRYTCDGTNTIPSFRWGPVPPGTAELALFLFKIDSAAPAANGGSSLQVSVEWAVAGLSPNIHAISAGKLPPGAVVASKPYSVCPAKGSPGSYLFQLNAISRRLPISPNFNATGLYKVAEGVTVASGTFASTYKRI